MGVIIEKVYINIADITVEFPSLLASFLSGIGKKHVKYFR